MLPLSPDLRRKLEKTIVGSLDDPKSGARGIAEIGAEAALKRLAVDRSEPFGHLTPEERVLRNRLRAKGRQLGDVRDDRTGAQSIERLKVQGAYEYWHRMLFARFLAENELLMHPDGVAVSLAECEELAIEENIDAWTLASRYAARMLPEIFRPQDALLQVEFAPEHKLGLEKLLAELPEAVFLAGDSLGWVYQFWQAKRKDEVNRSGNKIGARELPAVTQLFTEDYMVDFLLHNTLGAWWVANHPGEELPIEMPYLRRLEDGTPAAGRFEGLPKRAKELRLLDPCCGSGHFLVAEFRVLVAFRMAEEGLTAIGACDAVLRENLFGLEIDDRCVQIAAFALAIAAWTYPGTSGYRSLPRLNLACSGIAISAKREDWLALAGDESRLLIGMGRLYDVFKDAPTFGSLIDPGADRLTLLEASFEEIEPLLTKALEAERKKNDYAIDELGVAAQGIAAAARILSRRYHLVATNVPYLGRGRQDELLREFCKSRYPDSKHNLATVFLERCLSLCLENGSVALVMPQEWLSLPRYKEVRKQTLRKQSWSLLARIGKGGFETITGEVVNIALSVIVQSEPSLNFEISGLDVTELKGIFEKAQALRENLLQVEPQLNQLNNPDSVVAFQEIRDFAPLSKYGNVLVGLITSDSIRFIRNFWEVNDLGREWELFQSAPLVSEAYSGRSEIIFWQQERGDLFELVQSVKHLNHPAQNWLSGKPFWGQKGICVSQTGTLPATLYLGDRYDNSCFAVIPKHQSLLPAFWAFFSSPDFNIEARKRNTKRSIEKSLVLNISFNLEHWQKVAEEQYPNGLPEPYSNDPTQWIFDGSIPNSTDPLQVAVARLLGYRWHTQPPDDLDSHTAKDGIVCLPPVAGEPPAEKRLFQLLSQTYGESWTTTQPQLLTQVGYPNKTLDDWLRNGFFEQHCKRFHHRPFIWHIWDGHRSGFSALVNYHKLDRKTLETLTYTYLGNWINRQKDSLNRGESGAEAKLIAAEKLLHSLKLILEGEPPYDIFVRWKPLHQQPIGWEPDLNDGIRLNIRPFMEANILRKRPNIHWKNDRGKNPPGSYWGDDRINDLHLTLQEKRQAREELEQ